MASLLSNGEQIDTDNAMFPETELRGYEIGQGVASLLSNGE
ncbi:MAG: hypothetical protein NWS00_02185 [Opitutales bacterium]|nr:hypothetical protein [Opitutales bacterium]